MPSRKDNLPPGLGVDIGGVIITPARKSGDTSFFSSGYLDTPAIDAAFSSIKYLHETVFPDRVYLVSKAKSGTAQKTRDWLSHLDFYNLTGLTPDKLFFCPTREGKAPIAKRLGLTAFLDDRVDVLGHLSLIDCRILFASKAEYMPDNPPQDLQPAIGWPAVVNILDAHV